MVAEAAASERMVCLGVVTAPHGVRGAVRIRSFTARPEDLVAYGHLYDASGQRPFVIRLEGHVRAALIARIDGIDDRTAAETVRGLKLYVPRQVLPEPDADEYYHADLIGLMAETVAEDGSGRTGAVLGPVTAVEDYGAGPVLEIAAADGPLPVPFTRAVVPWVDLAAGRIGVSAIPGLLAPTGDESKVDLADSVAPLPADH